MKNVISRFGKEYDYYEEVVGSRNSFGQAESSWSESGSVYCMFTRENRTTAPSSTGERTSGEPVFYFYLDDTPPGDARIEVDGQYFEIETPTKLREYAVAGAGLVEDFSP
jgi:hypothetical protein